MHKLAIAAAVTATLGAGTAVVISATHNDAHADPHAPAARSSAHDQRAAKAASAHDSHGAALCDLMASMQQRKAPALAPLLDNGGSVATADATDCAAVARHLADLEADATHGPNSRPDETSLETCGAQYASRCESENWSTERRTCTLAAGDLINAHLCAGQISSDQAPTSVPANLACAVIGPQIAATLQAAGYHEDMPDLAQQLTSACDMGTWSIELRTCFASATTVDALQVCITPAE